MFGRASEVPTSQQPHRRPCFVGAGLGTEDADFEVGRDAETELLTESNEEGQRPRPTQPTPERRSPRAKRRRGGAERLAGRSLVARTNGVAVLLRLALKEMLELPREAWVCGW